MAKEIERKFLVLGDAWKDLGDAIFYRQGYLLAGKGTTVRVRTIGAKAYLTIKGPSVGLSRLEFEYKIPQADALEMLHKLCDKPLIEKSRTTIQVEGMAWEIDEFYGANVGLVLAEIELESEGQQFTKPPWIGREVSDDSRYFNANLARRPYTQW